MYLNKSLCYRASRSGLMALLFLFGMSTAFAAGDCPRGMLDEKYCDLDGDLVADLPSDPAEWVDPDTPLNKGVKDLLWLAGEVYLPYLDATHNAMGASEDRLRIEALGMTHEQTPMKYHARCLDVIRDKAAALSVADKSRLETVLVGTDCWKFLI